MGYRTERINETIKERLSSLIKRDLKDPRLDDAVISIIRTQTTPDIKYCKVFVSVYGKEDIDKKEIIGVLERAKGFLRKQISKSLPTKNAPELIFVLDESMDYALHIDEVLKGLDIKYYDDDEEI